MCTGSTTLSFPGPNAAFAQLFLIRFPHDLKPRNRLGLPTKAPSESCKTKKPWYMSMKTLGGKFAYLKQNEEGYLKSQSPFIASTF